MSAPENIFIFGLTAEEARARQRQGYDSSAAIAASPRLSETIAALAAGAFSPGSPERYAPIVDALRHNDRFLVTADFDAYYATQRRVDALWRNPQAWRAMSIVNVAHMGWFSSDRTIRDYAADIWDAPVGSSA